MLFPLPFFAPMSERQILIPPGTTKMQKQVSWAVVTIIALWALSLGLMFWLQQVLYANTGPFYDSASYYSQLGLVFAQTRTNGLAEGIRSGWIGHSSVIPWWETVGLVEFGVKGFGRWLGPVLQAPWVLMLLLTAYAFFRKAINQTREVALLNVLPFMFIAGVWQYDRGWSDFAMDLMSYVALAIGLIFYLWTQRADTPRMR